MQNTLNMISEKTLYQIALTKIKGVGISLARALMQTVGDEEAIFKESRKLLEKIPRISPQLVDEIRSPRVIEEANNELQFIEKNKIKPLFFTDSNYPQRLTNCIDAPILLYDKGNTDFNRDKVISIVGTRNATRYGRDFCENLIKSIADDHPDMLIVSGLAYGIDICAHRAAVNNNLSTVAVLAHGLDRIYPHVHRSTAIDMLNNGALLTEFPSETNPDRFNFVKRNRIVAGMSDAVVVIESAAKGGSLITADIANSYFREVFAVPGRVFDKESEGCNKLISNNKAILLQDPESLYNQMGWTKDNKSNKPIQRELFVSLTEDEERIFKVLNNGESKQVNMISLELDVPVADLFFTLLELEMKGLVKALPGGMYKLV